MPVGAEQNAGRVRKADGHRRQPGAHGPDPVELDRVFRIVRIIGAGEVRDQVPPVHACKQLRGPGQPVGLARRQAEPVHAGVDVEHGIERHPGAFAGTPPPGNLVGVVDDRDQPVFGQDRLGSRQHAAQHGDVDAGVGDVGAQRHGFIQCCDKEHPAPGPDQAAGHPGGPDAIGVGLDRGPAGRGPEAAAQQLVVCGNGVEIDAQQRSRRSGFSTGPATGHHRSHRRTW